MFLAWIFFCSTYKALCRCKGFCCLLGRRFSSNWTFVHYLCLTFLFGLEVHVARSYGTQMINGKLRRSELAVVRLSNHWLMSFVTCQASPRGAQGKYCLSTYHLIKKYSFLSIYSATPALSDHVQCKNSYTDGTVLSHCAIMTPSARMCRLF